MTLSAGFAPLPDMPALAARWQALERRSDTSFFLGWTWIESWLAATGARPELLTVQEDGEDVALALIGRAMQPRLLGPVATLFLNQAGSAAADRGFIEYNGLLKAKGAGKQVDAAAFTALTRRNDWRALRLSGIEPDSPLLKAGPSWRRYRSDVSPAYYVDLETVRAAGGDYLSLLGSNSRSQIRRSAKDYPGTPEISTAQTNAAMGEMLDEMHRLNIGRHADNAWDQGSFRDFARRLAQRGLEDGSVELLRITTGGEILGLLLNFVHRGVAMNYQSAFAEPISAKAKPGLMCHAAAVARYADAGLRRYSFLAGKDRYKQSLSTGSETLEWWTLERFSPRLEAEWWLRKLLRRPISA